MNVLDIKININLRFGQVYVIDQFKLILLVTLSDNYTINTTMQCNFTGIFLRIT